MKKKKICYAVLTAFIPACVAGYLFCNQSLRISLEKYHQVLDEVMSVDFPYRYLTPNNSGSQMAYVHEAEQGRGLFLIDLKTLARKQAPITNEITQICGWSPDDRYLTFIQTPPNLPKQQKAGRNALLKEEWLTLYDTKKGSFRRLTKAHNVIESRFVWLGTNSYLFVARPLAASTAEAYVGSFTNKSRIKISSYLPLMDNLVLTTDKVVAYSDGGEIFTLDLSLVSKGVQLVKNDKPPVVNPQKKGSSKTKKNKSRKGKTGEFEIEPDSTFKSSERNEDAKATTEVTTQSDTSKKHNLLSAAAELGTNTNGDVTLTNSLAATTNSLIRIIKGKQITAFQKEYGFRELKWLRYDRRNGCYLFCAVPRKSNWRFLYKYNSETKELVQLTYRDTYNGQLLENGQGFACVANTNFHFSLHIHPIDPNAVTNFFENGSLVSYAATPLGDKVYTVGSHGINPQGIWEYNLATRKLQLVADGFNKPFVTSRVIEPEQFKIKSFDGLEVPCYLYPPLNVLVKTNQNVFSTWVPTKYPAVIYAPPPSAAASHSFNARMQLFANMGFYVLAVNFRGCQGYGAKYASMNDTSEGAEDILAGREWLSKNCNVDMDRIFLSCDSGGDGVVNELLATRPELWRAASMEHPGGIDYSRFTAAKLPPIFFATGDQDTACKGLKEFDGWAKTNNVTVSSVIYTNSGHITFKSGERKDKLDRVGRFFMEHL